MSLVDEITRVRKEFTKEIEKVSQSEELKELRIKYLGRKCEIQAFYKALRDITSDERPVVGKALNELKALITEKLSSLEEFFQEEKKKKDFFDYTLPGVRTFIGDIHPLNKILSEISSIFKRMGFSIAVGPELEDDYHNFEALNIPKDHPARDLQDTFYISDNLLLRTHTSPVQIRVMEKQPPPIRIIAPGRVFRRDTPDATHSPIFYQVEGLYVDEGVTFGDLKGVIEAFAHALMGKDVRIRFRSGYFPFVEPGAEYDFSCIFCKGSGCSICKGTGWIEISGAGMVHPRVFEYVNIDPERYTGFAFGMGVERIFMLKYGVQDIRLFYENDIRFLNQF